ncbi:F-box/kelch-repeat protein At3g06240-like [Andrographis paniculata]|uniref:F-box/kelch-repeat protein At3g06240-like n=1 Tax=Andrographis paniculata TaxID=175694 RepID=UPI0021E74368|nr:F-box/kelch-repeat protein At3g06240-like [Andrographis paniculata]XP_051127644.1 F-box/kelch-repeat protein At3g06240-like [Andrographis paniculata]XP_051127645.1 F-box/kelch-repeat protein At3g06240-like [Andrographis paniculata]XP_051127646.1 F-box/kelch-repeat protein At3g06240-like [Andrographis paniculata]XP_051127647.1 F-box/kelch-repeat protein At3g06240-like [Andrographis paniculata]XP_051127648.1 F-box/kelch-repeat protein At3g06240-like [Andrographis paniculata]XP_051127649.1 F-
MLSELPRDIMIDIFSRLPAKSVGKCRCVAKPWQSLLSTPQFIRTHLSRKPHQETQLLIAGTHSMFSSSEIGRSSASKKIELGDTWTEFVGSCDGLVLLVNEVDEVFLVNPTTLEQVYMADSPLALKWNESFRMHGFGYDSCSDDYKIVTLSYYNTDNEYEPDCADTFVDVYSVKRNLWKRVDVSPYDHAVPELSPGAFVNGAIHWLASSREAGYRSVIAAFDLAHEVFDEIPPPNGMDVEKFVFFTLAVFDGCLCMVDIHSCNLADVWIMKVYGSADSWMKINIAADYEWNVIKPLCFVGGVNGGDMVLITEGETLVVYNQADGTLRDVVVDGVPFALDGGTFVETLVSPSFHLGDMSG